MYRDCFIFSASIYTEIGGCGLGNVRSIRGFSFWGLGGSALAEPRPHETHQHHIRSRLHPTPPPYSVSMKLARERGLRDQRVSAVLIYISAVLIYISARPERVSAVLSLSLGTRIAKKTKGLAAHQTPNKGHKMKRILKSMTLVALLSLSACAHSNYLSPEARGMSRADRHAHKTHCKYIENMLNKHGYYHTVDQLTLMDYWILNNMCSYKLRALLD